MLEKNIEVLRIILDEFPDCVIPPIGSQFSIGILKMFTEGGVSNKEAGG